MKNLLRCLVMLLLMATPQWASSSAIELSEPGDIRDIESLDVVVDSLVAKVRQCAAAGIATVNDCYCYYPGKLASTRSAYDELLSKHPDWENQPVRWRAGDSRYISLLDLSGLRKRIQQPCI